MLAIVIPYFKIDFFEQTLESLSNQTNKKFTVYIGDDASPQDCLWLLKQFESKFNFKYKKFDINYGSKSLVQQWNRCIDFVENEDWVTILGDDDVLSDDFVEQFYKKKHIFEREFNVIRFSVVKIDEAGKTISNVYTNSEIESSKNIILNNKRSSLSEYVFKLSEIRSIGFKDLPLAWWSDVLAVLEFSNFGYIYSINEAIVFVRISRISISGNQSNEVQKEKANYLFFYYLLKYKSQYFSSSEIDFLFEKVSKRFLNNRKKIEMFYSISILYLEKGKFSNLLQFFKKIINSIL
ncbi:glycosyltransferase [Flavobacterium lacustre]|uniref:glycosyltransferase n=1 Tax=Flavobacterium lacustre TaxID=3016339 RepID=UPI0022B61FFB|nr:glycosyltransferase [Flavobacterium lacustre]